MLIFRFHQPGLVIRFILANAGVIICNCSVCLSIIDIESCHFQEVMIIRARQSIGVPVSPAVLVFLQYLTQWERLVTHQATSFSDPIAQHFVSNKFKARPSFWHNGWLGDGVIALP